MTAPTHEVVIIGAGFGGIGAGIAIQRAGVYDFVLVDKWHDVGGTWLANTYPGVAVDIPSFVYSFSFEQRADWSRLFAPGAEIQRYASDVVDKYGLRPKLKLGTTILRCEFDEDEDLWHVLTDGGDDITARHLIPAIGALERPKLPDIYGIEAFGGTLMHTAMWDHDVDLAGRRVAVIGTGASSLQLVPEIADVVARLTVFQRTPIWVAPKVDFAVGPVGRFVLSQPLVRSGLRVSGTVGAEVGVGGALLWPNRVGTTLRKGAEQALRTWMRSQVDDPELRDKLTPRYALGCKRPSMSNTYLRTFTRDHVDLVTEPIERITEGGVVTADGVEHDVDVLVCATGFQVMDQGMTPPFPVLGRDGIDLRDFWHEHRYQAYQGVSVPGFPNLFLIAGPNGFVPGSYFWMVEATSAHAARAIAEARHRGATSVEIRQEPHERYWQQCLDRASKTLLYTENCAASNTYYLNYHGDAAALRPSLHAEMWWQNRHFPLDHYRYGRNDLTTTPTARVRARHPKLDFTGSPKYWVHGDPQSTHTLNILHYGIPAGERFFVDGVKAAMPYITDPQLLADARGFIGQEASHARMHEKAAARLGLFDIPAIRAGVAAADARRHALNRLVARLPEPARRQVVLLWLSAVAFAEHLTAVLADIALDDSKIDEAAVDPEMVQLVRWHAAEELEHRSVPYDIYEHVGGSYAMRAAVAVPGMALLPAALIAVTSLVMLADPDLRRPFSLIRHARAARARRIPSLVEVVGKMPAYLVPGHHPSKVGDDRRAERYLASKPRALAS